LLCHAPLLLMMLPRAYDITRDPPPCHAVMFAAALPWLRLRLRYSPLDYCLLPCLRCYATRAMLLTFAERAF